MSGSLLRVNISREGGCRGVKTSSGSGPEPLLEEIECTAAVNHCREQLAMWANGRVPDGLPYSGLWRVEPAER